VSANTHEQRERFVANVMDAPLPVRLRMVANMLEGDPSPAVVRVGRIIIESVLDALPEST